MGHARALLGLEGAAQITAANEVVAKKLSVRDTEKLVARNAAAVSAYPLDTRPAPEHGEQGTVTKPPAL
jgi:ParB family chromosome partitioning protein